MVSLPASLSIFRTSPSAKLGLADISIVFWSGDVCAKTDPENRDDRAMAVATSKGLVCFMEYFLRKVMVKGWMAG
jgi:hypothetical protein